MSPLASRVGRLLLTLAMAGSCAIARDAGAQPKSSSDEARELAKEGWKAIDAQKYKEALEKVTQAEALYHAPTHLLLMGNALAGLGRLADALATFEKLSAEPLPDASPPAFKEAQEMARKRIKELLSRVPSLLVVVQSSEAPEAVITVDGKAVSFAGGVAVRFDPGDHEIAVSAEGFVTVKKTIKLPEKGGVERVPMALERVRAASASGSAAASGAPTASALATGAATSAPPPGPSRLPAYISFGVGGASILAGAITGAMSLVMTSDLKARCPGGKCAPNDQSTLDTANAFANASTATFVIGGVAAAAGVVLMVVDIGPSKTANHPAGAARPHIEPWISLGGAGVRGSF